MAQERERIAKINAVSLGLRVVASALTASFEGISLILYARFLREGGAPSLLIPIVVTQVLFFVSLASLWTGRPRAIGAGILAGVLMISPTLVHMATGLGWIALAGFLGVTYVFFPLFTMKRSWGKSLAWGLGITAVVSVSSLAFLFISSHLPPQDVLTIASMVVVGLFLASFRETLRVNVPILGVLLPSLLVSFFAIVSFRFYGDYGDEGIVFVVALLAASLLSLLTELRRELGIVPASLATGVSIILFYDSLHGIYFLRDPLASLLTDSPPYFSAIPFALLSVVGFNSPRIQRPETVKEKLVSALERGDYKKAKGLVLLLKGLGIDETEAFLEVLHSKDCGAMFWMAENYGGKVDLSRCGKSLKRYAECAMKSGVVPPLAEEVLKVLKVQGLECAEKFSSFLEERRQEKPAGGTGGEGKDTGSNEVVQGSELPQSWVGKEIHHYKVHGVLSMNDKYYMMDVGDGKVMKVLTQSEDKGLAGAEYLKEVSECEGVLKVYDVFPGKHGQEYVDDPPAVVMEYMAGGTLRDLMKGREQLDEEIWSKMVKNIFVSAGRSLSCLHEHGYVHLNFSPDEVFLERDWNVTRGTQGVKIGVDKARKVGSMITDFTPYSPVDQVRAILHGGEANVAMDVYAWGASLYEAISGERYNPEELTSFLSSALSSREQAYLEQAQKYYEQYYGSNLFLVPTQFRQVIYLATNPDPNRRPPMKKLLEMMDTEG